METGNTTSEVVVISMNPNSGATDQHTVVDKLTTCLIDHGFEVLLLTDVAEMIEVVGQHFGGRLRCVVAAGGDGTISLLANELPENTPLAILPLGTENLLAKYLGVSAEPVALANMIVAGDCRQLDVGRANGKLFLVMASCGFDADVVHRLHSNRQGHIRHWSYAKPVVSAIRKYKYPKIRISLESNDDHQPTVDPCWAFVFNVPRYAMNLPIAAEANPEDGMLDLCTFRGGSLFRGLFYLVSVILRRHKHWTTSKTYHFKKLTMESDGEVPYQLDGDPGGTLPLTIEVVKGGVTLIVP